MKTKLFLLLGSFLITFFQLSAQDSDDIFEMSLEELMNMEITVASKKATTLRESPGIVTVITHDEIKASGARDLIDALNMVPGFEFGTDVSGVLGAGTRGLWAYEGKLLIMMDGMELQEGMYATGQFGNHYSVDQIKRIEVIRGPGSSIYGGNAELGVINIITKTAEDIDGGEIAAVYSALSNDFGRRNVNLNLGKKINDFSISVLGFYGQNNVSSDTFTDIYGTTYDMSKDGLLNTTMNLNAAVGYKNLKARLFYDNYSQQTVFKYDEIHPYPYKQSFGSIIGELQYDIIVNDKLTIVPRINYQSQKPWQVLDESVGAYDPRFTRSTGNITANYNPSDNVSLVGGAEYYNSIGKYPSNNDVDYFFNGTKEFSYSNTALFLQGTWNSSIANITLGARYDNNSAVDDAISPRIAVTKVINKFHAKFLYSQAFRTPAIENMNYAYGYVDGTLEYIAPEIKPERARVTELEFGYKLSDNMNLNANIFYTKILDPMVYFYDTNLDEEGYINESQYGSKGIEAEYRVKTKKFSARLGYAFYSLEGLNEVEYYAVPDNEAAALAFPQHKITAFTQYKINDHLSVNPSLIYKAKRYSYRSLDDNGTPGDEDDDFESLNEEPGIVLLNVNVNYDNLFTDGLDLGFGIYDLLNQKDSFIQPYNGWHTPIPASGIEVMFKLSYKF